MPHQNCSIVSAIGAADTISTVVNKKRSSAITATNGKTILY
jgi:hypothetical protein